ncbi:MAG: hypothetical protein IKT43_00815 [Clostridia bacterium]|nr:hypothetical protein [Clostridia bacterium]
MTTLFSFARRRIPLPENYDQTGYIARYGASNGVLDEPEIRVVLLREPMRQPALLIFCDLLGLAPAHTRALEEDLARLAGTTSEKVVITCTHTHSAPAAMSLLLLGEARESFVHELENTLRQAVTDAVQKNAVPCRMFFAKTDVFGVARNRVKLNETDVDPELTLLVFETAKGKLALVNYACHPVTKNADNRLYSRDYPGVVIDTLKEKGLFDEVIFATAPCGDLNPVYQDEEGKHTRLYEYGRKIARGVEEIIESGALMETEGFSVTKKCVHLPLEKEHGRANLKSERERAARARQSASAPQAQKYEEANYLWALSHEKLASLGLAETAFDATLTILKFGALTVIGVPFELFSDISMRLKDTFSPACVWELCGGDYGYFPSDELWDTASYERADAYMYYNRGGPLQKGSEARLFEALMQSR